MRILEPVCRITPRGRYMENGTNVFVMRNLVVGGKWQPVSFESILVIISSSKYRVCSTKN